MNQFDDAKVRAEKLQAKRIRYQPLLPENPVFHQTETTLHLPKKEEPKAPKQNVRTNEIQIIAYVDGVEMYFTARANFNDIIGSQRTRPGLLILLREALTSKFGKVDIA